jgi:micrococcal nuclease
LWRVRSVVVAVFATAMAVCSHAPAPLAPTRGAARLVRVVDGDTIVVAIERIHERVRLIGIDTPERGQCFFQQAAAHLTRLLERRRISLAEDVRDRDRYGRLLRYVYASGMPVNERMVSDGFAYAYTVPPDVARAGRLVALQRRARIARRGLWRKGVCASTATAPSLGTVGTRRMP